MLPYFPIERDEYQLTMNARAMPVDRLIEVDPACYHEELALKDEILASDYRYYYQAPPATEAMQWETIALLLPNMARYEPDRFSLEQRDGRWRWTNHLLGTTTHFTPGDRSTLPLPPLDWLGRQVQEDLLLLAEDADAGTPLVAGHLCFAAGWSLDDKMGQSFLEIHAPVPLFAERIGRPANLLMERLKPGHPTARVGWSITTTSDLNRSPKRAPLWQPLREGITVANAGSRCYLRLERQTFSRLPQTRAILFTIHTYRAPVAEVVAGNPERARRLGGAIRTMPAAMRAYKGLDRYAEALIAWLEHAGERAAAS